MYVLPKLFSAVVVPAAKKAHNYFNNGEKQKPRFECGHEQLNKKSASQIAIGIVKAEIKAQLKKPTK